MVNMITQMLRQDDITRAYLHQHEGGRVAIVIRLSNDLEIRLEGMNPTISGFLDWDKPTKRYIDKPVLIEDKIGL